MEIGVSSNRKSSSLKDSGLLVSSNGLYSLRQYYEYAINTGTYGVAGSLCDFPSKKFIHFSQSPRPQFPGRLLAKELQYRAVGN